MTGSVIALPNTLIVPAVTMTLTREKAVKLIGSPQKLPRRTAFWLGAKREKSQKLSIRVEK